MWSNSFKLYQKRNKELEQYRPTVSTLRVPALNNSVHSRVPALNNSVHSRAPALNNIVHSRIPALIEI